MHKFDTEPPDQPGVRKSVGHIEALRQWGGIFVEAVRVTRMPMIVTDPKLPDNPIIFANDAFLAVSGYVMDEVLGWGPSLLADPETDKHALEKVKRALAEGRSETVELLQRRKDGSTFRAVVFACPIRDESDRVVHHFFSYVDSSELLATQRAQVEAEQRFRLLVDSVADYAIYMLDPAGYVTSWNSGAERITGYSAGEIIGKHVSIFLTEEDRQAGATAQAELEAGRREGRFETEGWRVRKDGSKHWAHVVLNPIRNDSGELVGFANVTRDITERQQAREARDASEAKTQFLATMSHEIRTPLNGIIGYTERLMDEDLTPNQHRFAERIRVAGSMLLTIIDDILDFSRIEAGRIELEEHPFSLEALIDNTVSIISGAAEEKGLSVRLELGPNLPKVLVGDEARLRQVILNLLTNAVKFTHKGHVSLAVENEGRSGDGASIRFRVSDTGIGISADRHDRLFRRFSQVDRSVQREFGGTGLGLAISKCFVELMGGEIGFESAEERGSTFWIRVTLPVAKAEDIPSTVECVPERTPSARILVAEDLEMNLDLARSILEKAGHRVDVVSDGAEAVEAVKTRQYDLVLMDVQMPVMDGTTATRAIRALDSPSRHIPIIAMTANVLPQQIRSFKQAGIDDHIAKPMRQTDLLKKVGKWLPKLFSEAALLDGAASTGSGFDRERFVQLRDLVGRDRVSDWIRTLDEQLHATFEETSPDAIDPHELGRRAHAIVSLAGSLGFDQLAECCGNLEDACLSGDNLSKPFEDAHSAAHKAQAMLTSLSSSYRANP